MIAMLYILHIAKSKPPDISRGLKKTQYSDYLLENRRSVKKTMQRIVFSSAAGSYAAEDTAVV